MKNSLTIIFIILLCACLPTLAQSPAKDWTPWQKAGDWAQFYTFVNFKGQKGAKAELEKVELKKLKVECYIFGRLLPPLPAEVEGVKRFKIVYSKFGKYESMEGFVVDSAELPYRGREEQSRHVSILRPATKFDVDEVDKPRGETWLKFGFMNEPNFRKLEGQLYRLQADWRRKADLVEILLNDYRP